MGTLLSRLVFFSGAVAYPSYATISSLSAPRSGDDGAGLRPWLLYWVVFAWVRLADRLLSPILSMLPLYWTAKTSLYIWLSIPDARGAAFVFDTLMKPTFLAYRPRIERHLQPLQQIRDLRGEDLSRVLSAYAVLLSKLAAQRLILLSDVLRSHLRATKQSSSGKLPPS